MRGRCNTAGLQTSVSPRDWALRRRARSFERAAALILGLLPGWSWPVDWDIEYPRGGDEDEDEHEDAGDQDDSGV
jgi:hypothetical protein